MKNMLRNLWGNLKDGYIVMVGVYFTIIAVIGVGIIGAIVHLIF